MPPATRREVRLSASLPHPATDDGGSHTIDSSRSTNRLVPNVESILENFEHFKRKHLSQNREIIKANAAAHTRMRELENRIQTLEAEKVQKEIETIGLTAQLSQLRYAMGCIHAGWEAIGRGLTLGPPDLQSSSAIFNVASDSKLPPSNRVKVEPNPNAGAVVKHIATAPQGHIDSLPEETSFAGTEAYPSLQSHANDSKAPPAAISEARQQFNDWQRQFKASRSLQQRPPGSSSPFVGNTSLVSALDFEGAPSPMGSPELAMELEDVIAAAAASRSDSHHWSLPHVTEPPHVTSTSFEMQSGALEEPTLHQSTSQQSLRRSGRKSSRRQSGFVPQHDFEADEDDHGSHSPDNASASSSSQPSSDPYLPSEANSEAMDGVLVYRCHDEPPTLRSSSHQHQAAPLNDITNGAFASNSTLHGYDSSYRDDERKTTDSTPRKARGRPSDTASASHAAYSSSTNPPPTEARTPGGRKRKIQAQEPHDSMPTPARFFSAVIEATPSAAPAAGALAELEAEPQVGRTRRVRKSINYALPKLNTKMRKPDPSDLVPASTPHRSHSNTPASARGMVGSTGNLSDIRKLHEAAAMRQSPAERTSNMRTKGSPSRGSGEMSRGDEEGSTVRMADLFEIRQHANHLADRESEANRRSNPSHAFWSTDGITDTSDDESRVTSNADLGELAELEAAMSDLCTADEGQQVDTPRAPQPSMWPSRSATQISASSSTDSMASCSSSVTSNDTASKRPSLRRKTTPLPSRSQQSSVEKAMQVEIAPDTVAQRSSDTPPHDAAVIDQESITPAAPSPDTSAQSAVSVGSVKVSSSAQNSTDTRKPAERTHTASAASNSTVLGNGRPPSASSGLAAGMKPKQRPASAGAALAGSRSASASSNANAAERPRTFSGTTAANAGLSQTGTGSARTANATSNQRASLHSALTNQSKATSGQITPRIGAKGLPASNTPASKESPRLVGTPVLRPVLSTSSLASESSGRSSPALSAASTSSAGTQLSTTTRTSLKPQSTVAQQTKMQRPGTAGSTACSSTSSRDASTPRLNGSSSNTSMSTTAARPHPARSMPSLRRASEKTGVTSTPRITVRSSSSTLPAAAGGSSGTSTFTTAATIAASRVAKAISSTAASRAREASTTPMGLGIDFSSMLNDNAAGKELIHLTDEIHQVIQSSSSPSVDPSSSLSSETHSSSPTTASKTSSDDGSVSGGSAAKVRRTSRRVSGLTA